MSHSSQPVIKRADDSQKKMLWRKFDILMQFLDKNLKKSRYCLIIDLIIFSFPEIDVFDIILWTGSEKNIHTNSYFFLSV